jgi:cytochrome c oxidase subunit 2
VLIVGAMLYFAWKYRRRNGVDHETPQIEGSHTLEIIWTVVPTIICIFIAYYGIIYYRDIRAVPTDAYTINAIGQKWFWDFEYENGKKTSNELVVPVDRPVRVVLSSRDVLHSFYIPTMRVKSDAVPGRFTYVSFTPVKAGEYQGFCTEYCGTNHWDMLFKLKVVSQAEFDTWLNDRSAEIKAARMNPAELGAEIYTAKGCQSCHSIDGSPRVGPSLLKLFGKNEQFTDGSSATIDEEYLRTAIYDPNKQIVAGFSPNMMPVFADQINEEELKALIAFIKSLDGSKTVEVAPAAEAVEDLSALSPEQRGEKLFSAKTCNACHSLDGSKLVGPSLKGLVGKNGKLADGNSYTADEAYIAESIKNPAAKVVEGFPPAMPQLGLKDEEISDLIAYLETVK